MGSPRKARCDINPAVRFEKEEGESMYGWPGDGGNDTVVCEGTSGENPPRGGAEQPVV